MGSALLCKNEQDALLELKVKIMTMCQECYLAGNVKRTFQLMEIFDHLPAVTVDNQVDVKCRSCTFPDCELAQNLARLGPLLDAGELAKIKAPLAALGYSALRH